MKVLLKTSLLFILLFLATSLAAQDNYKKFLHLSYAELDSLMGVNWRKGDFNNAIPYMVAYRAKKEIEFGEQYSDFVDRTVKLAFFYSKVGQYQHAELLYLEALAIEKRTLGDQHLNYAASLNNLASLYKEMGDYTKAEDLYLQALAIVKKTTSNPTDVYFKSKDNTKIQPIHLMYYVSALNNLAGLYIYMTDYIKAEPLFIESVAISKELFGAHDSHYATSLHNLAVLYCNIDTYNKAESLFLQAIAIQKKELGEQHPDYANSLNHLAILYKNMGKSDSAFYYCRLGILALAPTMDSSFADWGNLDMFSYTSNEQINNSIQTLLSILQKQYEQSKDQNKLESHYAVSQAAIRLNEHFRNGFIAEGDKLRILAENNGFVLAAIKTGIKLGRADYEAAAFGFAEMNKGVLLLEAIKTGNAQQFGDLPDTLAEQEINLQKKQSSLTAKLLEKRPAIEKDSLRRVLNGINQEVDIFTHKLKNEYPKYAALKYDHKTTNAREIQALLDDKTALLEYMIGDSVIYVFYVDKKQVKLTAVYLSNKVLNEKIKTLHSVLSDYESVIKDRDISYQKYSENAYWFYDKLVGPALKHAKGIQSLIIIPDGELAHLPFEIFLTKPAAKEVNNYKELSYLLKDYKISYNYAATVWKSNKEATKHKNNGQLLAIAGNYELKADDSSKMLWTLPYEQNLRAALQPLPAAKQEVETLAKSFKGFFAFDTLASEKRFKEKASEYAIIHLAMHGLSDSRNPILSSLAFTDYSDSVENNFLQAYEISKMQLNADLVVLSACETGYGKFETGNGTASLARAFMYAGVPALVVSLWQVNDASTSSIMQAFYKNLAKGMDKAEALQQAKLAYVETIHESSQQGSITAHPAFWSPFILIGNTEPIKIARKPAGWWLWGTIGGGGLLLLGIGVFAIRRSRKEA